MKKIYTFAFVLALLLCFGFQAAHAQTGTVPAAHDQYSQSVNQSDITNNYLALTQRVTNTGMGGVALFNLIVLFASAGTLVGCGVYMKRIMTAA